jgi:hypothetical protein
MKIAINSLSSAMNFQHQYRIIDHKAFHLAQRTARNAVSKYEWECAIFKLKQAYGFEAKEPFPILGDVRGNYTCTYSNLSTGEYHFTISRLINGDNKNVSCF